MRSKTQTIVVLSDLHIGSTVGLWPDKFVAGEGFPIGQNRFQEWLWACWEDCKKFLAATIAGADYEVVWNGDLVEGIHHRTTQVMSADVADQTTATMDVIGSIWNKAARNYVVQGTEVHTRNDEARMGKVMGGVVDPETGKHAFDLLRLNVNGCEGSFSHHMPSSIRPYLEASAHSILLGAEIMESVRAGHTPPKLIVHAHRHRHGLWTDGALMSASTGAWQGLTRFGRKVVPHAIPQPSCIIFDWRGKKKGELPQPVWKVWTPAQS